MDRQRTFLLGLVTALLAVSILFVLPFLDYFLLAVILGYVLRPVQTRLEAHARETVAAGLIVLGAAGTIIVPLLLVVRTTIVEARRLLNRVRTGEATFANVEASIVEVTGMDVDLSAAPRDLARDLESVPAATSSPWSARSPASPSAWD